MKSGFKTSEFWMTLLTQIVGFLVLSGKLSPENGAVVTSVLDVMVKGIVDIIAGGYMIYTAVEYIKGRMKLKRTVVEKQASSITV